MKIHSEPITLKSDAIVILEEQYNGKYVFESCIKTKDGGWADQAFAIFYTEEPHPEGSNYFAIGRNSNGDLIITDGISATEEFTGVLYNGEVYFSRYHHDFRQFNDGLFVDGGRNYTRFGGVELNDCKIVRIRVNKNRLEVVNEKVSNSIPSDVANCYISGYLT